jgi:hypothetical protein
MQKQRLKNSKMLMYFQCIRKAARSWASFLPPTAGGGLFCTGGPTMTLVEIIRRPQHLILRPGCVIVSMKEFSPGE